MKCSLCRGRCCLMLILPHLLTSNWATPGSETELVVAAMHPTDGNGMQSGNVGQAFFNSRRPLMDIGRGSKHLLLSRRAWRINVPFAPVSGWLFLALSFGYPIRIAAAHPSALMLLSRVPSLCCAKGAFCLGAMTRYCVVHSEWILWGAATNHPNDFSRSGRN